ncbi:3'-5' exonuclease [Gordonia zhaorongruii]|uniref:3'-5' exonuclease n=1 Tax=Gordonia zhaorongruii TaxID=2597659 RepID=UPI00117CA4C2|nr:3'-5' exonuclease [Gordonia zhaorongruii]
MATITLMKKDDNVDGSIKARVFSALQKLQTNDATAGAHVEPIQNCVDSRIRSVRVNDKFRFLVFKIDGGEEPHYIYVGTYPHDEAYRVAEGLALRVNPINGVISLLRDQEAAATPKQSSQRKAEEAAAKALAQAADAATTEPAPDSETVTESPATGAPAANTAAAAPSPEATSPADVFVAGGHTVDSLEAELGINLPILERALAADTADQLDKILDLASPWERDALIGIAAGMSVSDVKTDLGLHGDVPVAESDDESILRALDKPASQMEFTSISEDELRAIIDSGNFEAWTTFLHPTQRRVANRPLSGPGRVSGGAGTGKTVVALHRTRALYREKIGRMTPKAGGRRVFLTTFTTSLADNLVSSLAVLDPTLPVTRKVGQTGIAVSGIDKAARAVLSQASTAELETAGLAVLGSPLRSVPKPLVSPENGNFWAEAHERAANAPTDMTGTPEFLAAEFETVVVAGGVTTKSQYLKANRAGRGTALNRKARLAVWSVIEAYLAMTTSANTHTFPVIGSLAAAALDARADQGGERLVDHVIVDEAQDFHAGHWRLIRALVESGANDIFISEDSHQRIYGHAIRLSHFDIKIVGRATRLTLNYRTTSETLRFAMSILGKEEYTDTSGETDSIAGYHSARTGPEPVIVREESLSEELDAIAAKITAWLTQTPDATVGVLTHNRSDCDVISDGLEKRGITVSEKTGHGVNVMTMHSAKGLEFEYVALAGVSQRTLPGKLKSNRISDEEKHAILQRERSLLYVASSRARDELFVSTGKTPSELLPTGSVPGTAS